MAHSTSGGNIRASGTYAIVAVAYGKSAGEFAAASSDNTRFIISGGFLYVPGFGEPVAEIHSGGMVRRCPGFPGSQQLVEKAINAYTASLSTIGSILNVVG